MTIQEIIIQFKARTGMNNEGIAEQLGVAKSTVARWVNGDVKNLRPATLKRLSELLGMDVTEARLENAMKYRKPLLGVVRAGYNLLADENIEEYLDVSESDERRGDFFLRVTGHSMDLARIHDNDLVYVQRCDDVASGTIAVVMIGDEVTIKRVVKRRGLLILEAASTEVENRYFTSEEVRTIPVRIIGRVLYSRSDFV